MVTLGILASKLSMTMLKVSLIIISHYKMKYYKLFNMWCSQYSLDSVVR